MLAGLKAIDWIGSLTITSGILMFLLGLQFGGVTYPWGSKTVVCLIVFGVVAVSIFIIVEWMLARYPIIPMHLYTSLSNLATLLVVFFHGCLFTQGTYFLPLYFQSVLGATPLLSGVWLLPFALALSLSSIATGIYIKKTGRYLDCIRFGFAFSVLGYGLFYNLPDSKLWAKIIIYQIICGIGTGPNFQAPLIALQSSVSAQDNATVTASFGLTRNLASSIAVVIGSAAFSNRMTKQQALLQAMLGNTIASRLSGNAAQANVFIIDELSSSQQKVARHAFYTSVRSIWIESVSLAAAGFLSCLLIVGKKLNKAHEEVKTGLQAEEERRRIAIELKKGKQQQNMKA